MGRPLRCAAGRSLLLDLDKSVVRIEHMLRIRPALHFEADGYNKGVETEVRSIKGGGLPAGLWNFSFEISVGNDKIGHERFCRYLSGVEV